MEGEISNVANYRKGIIMKMIPDKETLTIEFKSDLKKLRDQDLA